MIDFTLIDLSRLRCTIWVYRVTNAVVTTGSIGRNPDACQGRRK